ncbi:MAG: hypothetical protein RL215_2365 [Planctomycetota bacterium]
MASTCCTLRDGIVTTMRATISFGLAGAALAIATANQSPGRLVLFPLTGLVASILIHRGSCSRGQRIAGSILATAAFGLTGLMVAFSLISLQADIEPLWGAFSWGLGFGAAGAISGRSLSRLWRPGSRQSPDIPFAGLTAGVAFTLSGAIAGFLAFLKFPTWNVSGLIACIWLAFQLGGVGCDVGWNLCLKRSKLTKA